MTKTVKTVVAIAAVALICVIAAALVLGNSEKLPQEEFFVTDFKENKEDFERMAQIIATVSNDSFADASTRMVNVLVRQELGSDEVTLRVKDETGELEKAFMLSAEDSAVYFRILKCFAHKDAQLTSFCYDKETKAVRFRTYNGWYSLVYSPENKKPEFINNTYELENELEYLIEKADKNWYHIAMN